MIKSVINVEGMSCNHCVKAVSDAVSALAGVSNVVVDLASKTATVEHDPALCSLNSINSAIEEQGFNVILEN